MRGTKCVSPFSENVLTLSTNQPNFLVANAKLINTGDCYYSSVPVSHPDHGG